MLVGARAAGKTTLGRALARVLGWRFCDADQELRRRTGRSAAQWLRRRGEARFRRAEARVTQALLSAPGPLVVALGGGAVLDPGARARLRRCPCVVWLRAAIPTLVARLVGGQGTRPALTALAPRQEVAHLLRVRTPLYRAVATHTLNTTRGNVEELVQVLLARLRVGS